MSPIDVLVYTPYFKPGYKGGGPIKSIYNMTQACSERINFKVVTNDRDLGDERPYSGISTTEWTSYKGILISYVENTWLCIYKIILPILFQKYDVLYLNSYFSFKFSLLPLLVSKLVRAKVVLAPRGEFSSGALALKSRKKYIFLRLVKLLRIHENVIFQATSEQERSDIKSIFPKSIIQLAENITLLDRQESKTPSVQNSTFTKLVFLSRVSPKKNLLFAIKSLRHVHDKEVSFDIFGPIEDHAYWASCEAEIETLPDNIKVVYQGGIQPQVVQETLSEYDAFFFPTLGENYGHVIAEALQAGLPLIISDQTPWRNLTEKRLGWDLPLNDERLFSEAIIELTCFSKQEYSDFRDGVYKWSYNYFSSTRAIDETFELFFSVVE